jgi:methyl-accepting chemotaxis protein
MANVFGLFARIGIGAKVISILLMSIMVGVGVGLYEIQKIKQVDSEYSRIIEVDVEAAVETAELGERGQEIGRLTYRMLTESDTQAPRSRDEIDTAFKEARQILAPLAKLIPEKAAEYRSIEQGFAAVEQQARRVVDAKLSGNQAQADRIALEDFAPVLRGVRREIDALVEWTDKHMDEASAKESDNVAQAVALSYVALAIGAVLSLVIGLLVAVLGIVRPLRSLNAAMEKLASGDTSFEIAGTERGDEIGAMAKTVQVFRENAIKVAGLKAEEAAREAKAKAEKVRAMNDLADTFERSVGGIVTQVAAAATQLEGAANTLTAASEETNMQSSAVAAASEEASTNVQTVAAASEELASSIREIGRQVEQSARIAGKAVGEAADTTARVKALSEAAERIGSIVQLINEIAGKTNLLALNATIEAARAGEAGRGFAVVAQEVKGLAEQTAKATAEIGGQIGAIQ